MMNAETLKQLPPEQRCFYLLGLQPGASREEVRNAYRRLNLRYHPDRPGGGDPNKFLLISKAYAQAVQVIEHGHIARTGSARTHEELRTGARRAVDQPADGQRVHQSLDPHNFNVDRFNAAFENFHVQEPWMRGGYEVDAGGPREEQPEIRMHPHLAQGQRNGDAFRRAFEQEIRDQRERAPRDLILYQDPLPQGGGGGGLQPAMLGDCPEDFTDDAGRYTDYLKAHSVYNLCAPPTDEWTEPPARSLDAIKASRERIDPLSEEERAYLERREQERLAAEERRLARLREYDAESEKRYLESHQLLIGQRPVRS